MAQMKERNREIYRRVLQGESYASLGREYGVGRQRIVDIYKDINRQEKRLQEPVFLLMLKFTDNESLAVRVFHALQRANCYTMDAVVTLDREACRKIRCIGAKGEALIEKTIEAIKEKKYSMVTFKKIYESEKEIHYEYYPEDEKESVAGLIGIDLDKKTIDVLQPAEKDRIRHIPVSELNEKREEINVMRAERGEPPLTEEELPHATKDEYYYVYGIHAVTKIMNMVNEGQVPDKGTVLWY